MFGGGAHRTIVSYKDSQSLVKLDPMPSEWTGTFRDGRPINPLGADPENALTGTIFTVNAWRHDSLEVPSGRYGGCHGGTCGSLCSLAGQ